MTPEEPVKMCPVWQHECYGEKCQAWKDDRCEIIHMATLSFTSWGQPTYFDPTKVTQMNYSNGLKMPRDAICHRLNE